MKKEHHEILMEEMGSQFNLVLEGHESLRHEIRDLSQKTDERFDLVDVKINALHQKIDGVAADLKAHSADTEAHHGVYTG